MSELDTVVGPTYDCVMTYHSNPYTCGIARFNHRLAETLGVPLVDFNEIGAGQVHAPLVSVNASEVGTDMEGLGDQLNGAFDRYGLFLHDYWGTEAEIDLIAKAHGVFAAHNRIGEEMRAHRSDVVDAFCPGAEPHQEFAEPDLRLLTFGMAHKIRAERYARLGDLLARDERSYRLDISTALHEGTRFDEALFEISDGIRHVFKGQVRFLGFLSDDLVSEHVRRADLLVAFFPRGARENNTSVLSAMAHGTPVITNLDEFSPSFMRHGESVLDITQVEAIPSREELREIGARARIASAQHGFKQLGDLISERSSGGFRE
ncbi:MAG: glycosyltransferase [Actinomycetota bacterium]|nr:glycosyltransferase [Actinomycetota bacterium]